MKRNGILIVGLIISIFSGGGFGFLLSFLIIGPSAPPQEYFPDPHGRIIQTQFKSIDDHAEIFNYTTTEQLMPGTNITLEKGEGTYLLIRFNGFFVHQMSDNFRGESKYEIRLKLNGVVKRITTIIFWQDGADPLSGFHYFTQHLTLEFVTDILPPGVYSVEITWFSQSLCSAPGGIASYASILQGWVGAFPYNRTLLVQEIFS